MYAHKNATYNLPLTYVQKAALKEHYLDRLLCLTLVIKEDTINVHNCSNLQHYLAADTASLLHYSGFSSAVQACALVRQQWPRAAARLVPHCQAIATPTHVHRAKQKIAYKSSQAMYFHCLLFRKCTGMPVVNPALLSIKMSLPASFL